MREKTDMSINGLVRDFDRKSFLTLIHVDLVRLLIAGYLWKIESKSFFGLSYAEVDRLAN